jgi:nitrous oxidase accessory protein NosD
MFPAAVRRILGSKRIPPARRPALRAESLEVRWVPAVLTVDPTAGTFHTIAAAVAAAHTGDTVLVDNGTYDEAVVVATDNLKLLANGTNVVVRPTAPVTPSALGSALGIGAAVVDVVGAKNVTVSGFKVDGTSSPVDVYAGIRVIGNGSATITRDTVTGVNTAADADFGIGIQVGTFRGPGSPGTAKVDGNTVVGYKKVGILVDGAGSSATVTNNTVAGGGPASPFAGVGQIGVQVSADATARVEKNLITDNDSGSDTAFATGILVDSVSTKKTVIDKNVIDRNQSGVYVFNSAGVQVVQNDVTNTGNNGGIVLDTTFDSVVKNNDVCGAQSDGISLVFGSSDNQVWNNDVHGAQDGILLDGSDGPVDGNTLHDNDLFGNAANGAYLLNATNTQMFDVGTWGNGQNGVKIEGGAGNTLLESSSALNCSDGILLLNTTRNTIKGDVSALNGGVGLHLIGATDTKVTNSVLTANAGGNFVADGASSYTIDNTVIGWTRVRQLTGAANDTDESASTCADADALTAGL